MNRRPAALDPPRGACRRRAGRASINTDPRLHLANQRSGLFCANPEATVQRRSRASTRMRSRRGGAWTLDVGRRAAVGLVVALTAACVVAWSASVASLLPLALRRLRPDPAGCVGPIHHQRRRRHRAGDLVRASSAVASPRIVTAADVGSTDRRAADRCATRWLPPAQTRASQPRPHHRRPGGQQDYASVAARLLEMYAPVRRHRERGSRRALYVASNNYEGMLIAQNRTLQSGAGLFKAGARAAASDTARARLGR
jgi:hypothetical protein